MQNNLICDCEAIQKRREQIQSGVQFEWKSIPEMSYTYPQLVTQFETSAESEAAEPKTVR